MDVCKNAAPLVHIFPDRIRVALCGRLFFQYRIRPVKIPFKIARSKQLLQEGFSVTQVSDMLSFDTPNYFATLFKKYTGKTPSQYRSDPSQDSDLV
ncbi:MAG: AraC family transcriptional regulator [Eisenbergiella sp.]